MRTFSGKRSALALAIAGVTAMSGTVIAPEAKAAGFIEDSTLTGGIYYWQRERDRKDVTEDKYKTNLSHSTERQPTSSQATPRICSVWISPRSPRSKWRKTATAATRTKSPSPPATKPMMKTGPGIRAVSASTKPQRNSNTARSGRVGLYSANRPDAVSPTLELYAGYLSGCRSRG